MLHDVKLAPDVARDHYAEAVYVAEGSTGRE
jgi:hypothetical protein